LRRELFHANERLAGHFRYPCSSVGCSHFCNTGCAIDG
jgi:hypothetical protein